VNPKEGEEEIAVLIQVDERIMRISLNIGAYQESFIGKEKIEELLAEIGFESL